MKLSKNKLADLIDMDDPQAVQGEVHHILVLMFPRFDPTVLSQVFQDIVSLFQGDYPGYRGCNTQYHDLKHTTDCWLAMARLMHGALINDVRLAENSVLLGLIAALLHDTGYIQTAEEESGTGGKYTLVHVERSIAFLDKYLRGKGFSAADCHFCHNCLKCTGLNVNPEKEVRFLSRDNEIVGKMLGTADLLGQMADRTYLEKLPFLYREFQEAGVPGFDSELDLLKKTPDFWEFTQKRFATELGNMDRYMRDHFRVRWGINRDLNQEAVEIAINYLKYVLAHHEGSYAWHLRRKRLMYLYQESLPAWNRDH